MNVLARPVSRREALLWIAGLMAGAGAGACSASTLFGMLYWRRVRTIDEVVERGVPEITTTPQIAPYIVPRDAWGARPINHQAQDEFGFAPQNPEGWYEYPGDLAQVYTTVAIHHSYPVRSDGTMRAIQDMHLDTRKWADIGYHYGVARDGTIYAGRDIKVRGANVAGYNTGTIGVVAIGDFTSETPTEAQLKGMVMLIRWLSTLYSLTHLGGHYEFNNDTACPGTYMRPLLDGLAAACGLGRGKGGYIPPTQTGHRPAIGNPIGCCGGATNDS